MANPNMGVYISQENISDGTIRLIFKIYFLVLLVFTGIIGGICCRMMVKYKLLRGQVVSLTATTGWVHGPGLAKMSWELRRIPGGWLGALMIIASILDIVADLGVAKTITSVSYTTTAYHAQGMVLSVDSQTSAPDINWEAARWSLRAQDNSYLNAYDTGLGQLHYAIYKMVTNDTHFLADDADEIGYWSCSKTTPVAITYNQTFKGDSDEIYDNDIWQDLYDKNLLYGSGNYLATSNVSVTDPQTGYSTGPSTHTVILTASNYIPGNLFEIKAGIDTYDVDDKGTKQMKTWDCLLRAKDAAKTVESIAKVIDIDSTLASWAPGMVGQMFPGLHEAAAYDDEWLEITLQKYLNAMIMVSGSDESVTTSNTDGYQVGVYALATVIPYWVIAIAVISFALALFLVSCAIFLWFAIRAARAKYTHTEKGIAKVSAKEIDENVPVGMMDWMTHAAYESRDVDEIPKKEHLRNWILSTSWHAGRRLGIVPFAEHGQVNPLKTPGTEKQMTQYEAGNTGYVGASGSYFPPAKGQYVAVNTREAV